MSAETGKFKGQGCDRASRGDGLEAGSGQAEVTVR